MLAVFETDSARQHFRSSRPVRWGIVLKYCQTQFCLPHTVCSFTHGDIAVIDSQTTRVSQSVGEPLQMFVCRTSALIASKKFHAQYSGIKAGGQLIRKVNFFCMRRISGKKEGRREAIKSVDELVFLLIIIYKSTVSGSCHANSSCLCKVFRRYLHKV